MWPPTHPDIFTIASFQRPDGASGSGSRSVSSVFCSYCTIAASCLRSHAWLGIRQLSLPHRYYGNALSEALLRRDRLAFREPCSIHRSGSAFSAPLRSKPRDPLDGRAPRARLVVLSIAAVGLMYWLIRRSAATGFASPEVPVVTALFAFILFGERLDALSIVGMLMRARANRGARQT